MSRSRMTSWTRSRARADDLAYAGILLYGPRTLVDHLTGSLPLLR